MDHDADGSETARLAEELALRLHIGANALMDRLFEYLSSIGDNSDDDAQAPIRGLTLPASAMGWLSSQLYPTDQDDSSVLWMGASVRDRLALLKFLLARATHVRVTSDEWPPPLLRQRDYGRPHTPPPTSPTANMVGRDLSFGSSMSVGSGLTMETHVPTGPPNLRSFLVYYYQLQNRPRVDCRVLPQLRVLILDRIPPEWVQNIRVARSSLQLLRINRGCIYNLSKFLFPDEIQDSTQFEKLTHLKLTHCAIGELSGLRGKRQRSIYLEEMDPRSAPVEDGNYRVLPPLSRLPNLVSLSLAHNEIASARTALAGLSSLTKLSRLDLSYNRLTSFRNAHAQLGNVQVLILTGNQIRTARGLDRLYSLEELALDNNKIQEVSDVAGLASLPQLVSLGLSGNPLVDKKNYRVEILNLFRESRFKLLPPKATYRQLLEILPMLDGKPATNRELVGLRGYAFGIPVDMMGEEATTSTPVTEILSEETPQFSFERKRTHRVSKLKKARKAIVDEGSTERYELRGHDIVDQLEEGNFSYRFSAGDVISTLWLNVPDHSEESSVEHERELPDDVVQAFGEIKLEKPSPEETSSEADQVDDQRDESGTDLPPLPTPTQPPQGLSFISLSTVKADKEGASTTEPFPDEAEETIESETSLPNPQSPTRSPMNAWDEKKSDIEAEEVASGAVTASNEAEDSTEALHESRLTTEFDAAETSTDTIPELPEVAVPRWDDDRSALSSLGTNKDDFPAENKSQIAEESSIYDGPDNYRHLPILVNLELYFRCFVFPSSVPEKYRTFEGEMTPEEKAGMMLELAPRIQLRRADRAALEGSVKDATHPMELIAACERFNRVWKEDILACGKAAAKRLTPHRIPKRGFHGDVLFTTGKLEKSCNCRKVILCTSRLGLGGVAFYLIADYDAVTHQALLRNKQVRRFPSPIPEEAPFERAAWPHAVARHLIVSLNRITIGFGFQRLTLHFSNDNSNAETFTYVVLTCNKLRTVSLLQHIQDHIKEVGYHGTSLFGGSELIIDNDDKQVLDALSSVVAPDALGVVLHYQIVQQKWKHGDRGTVRRACVVTDTNLYLLDEDYVGDGSESFTAGARQLGDVTYKMVDSCRIDQITEVQAANEDPTSITVVIRPTSRLQRTHRWRLVCRDREGAERLVDDVRKAISLLD